MKTAFLSKPNIGSVLVSALILSADQKNLLNGLVSQSKDLPINIHHNPNGLTHIGVRCEVLADDFMDKLKGVLRQVLNTDQICRIVRIYVDQSNAFSVDFIDISKEWVSPQIGHSGVDCDAELNHPVSFNSALTGINVAKLDILIEDVVDAATQIPKDQQHLVLGLSGISTLRHDTIDQYVQTSFFTISPENLAELKRYLETDLYDWAADNYSHIHIHEKDGMVAISGFCSDRGVLNFDAVEDEDDEYEEDDDLLEETVQLKDLLITLADPRQSIHLQTFGIQQRSSFMFSDIFQSTHTPAAV